MNSNKGSIEQITNQLSKIEGFHRLSIEDFEIKKCIGYGSYGKVFLVKKLNGRHKDEFLAMKVLKKKEMMKREIKVYHTKNERRIMEILDNPFIVKLKYAFQNDRKIYLVTNYCQGGELYYHLNRIGPFNQNAVAFYAAQIILALEYMHDLQIIYREYLPFI